MRRAARPFGLYRRGAVWWCRIRGHKESTGCTDYNEAVREAARRDTATPDRPANAPAAASFRDAIDRFIEAKRALGRSEGTFDMYDKKSRHLAQFIGETRDVNLVKSEVVDKYIVKRRGDGAKANTIHKELVTLRGILRQAKRDKTFAPDIGEVMPIAFDPEYTPRSRFLTPSQLDRVLAELTPDHAAVTAFLVAAACRLGDMTRADASDLTSDPGFIRVRATKTKKNREGFRLVPVTALNKTLLQRIKAGTKGRKGKLFAPWSNIIRDLAAACDRASACKACRDEMAQRRTEGCKACKKVEVIPHVTPNDLRRTHAKWLRAHGVEHGLIGDVLGHVDGRMAKRVYGQTEPDMLAAILKDRIGSARRKRSA